MVANRKTFYVYFYAEVSTHAVLLIFILWGRLKKSVEIVGKKKLKVFENANRVRQNQSRHAKVIEVLLLFCGWE